MSPHDALHRHSFAEEENDSEVRPLMESFAGDDTEDTDIETSDDSPVFSPRDSIRASLIRFLALLCVCSLSIGSHYASYILGPLKSRLSRELGTSNTEFGLLLAALASSGTWTPLVGGIMASRMGTATTSVIATGAVFLGQLLLLIGHLVGEVRLMTLGMFIYGLGTGPLAVVQETIIVRFFKFHSLGISLALGLVAGKGASFVSARTSYPLSQYSPSAPFVVATAATGFSFIVNLIYISISKWLIRGSGADYDGGELSGQPLRRAPFRLSEAQALRKVAEKRQVRLKEIFKLGDVFWAYIGLNILCGVVWSPFTHLAPSILETRFHLTEMDAGDKASFLLGGSVLLYPLCGLLVDRAKKQPIVIQLLACASILTLVCYVWLSLPPTLTKTPWPAIIPFGTALGFSTLLLVVIVPQLVPLEYVSTALGMHKSLEHAGTTVMQTLTGLWLDSKKKKIDHSSNFNDVSSSNTRIQWLLNSFVFLNILQLLAIWGLAYLDRQKRNMVPTEHEFQEEHEQTPQQVPLLQSRPTSPESYVIPSGPGPRGRETAPPGEIKQGTTPTSEIKRGKIFVFLCAGMIMFSWILFLATSFLKIRSKQDREGR